MKHSIVVVTAVTMTLFAWWLGSSLASDAVAMVLGVVFGVLSMFPARLIVAAAQDNACVVAAPAPAPARVLRVERTPAPALPDYSAERRLARARRLELEEMAAADDADAARYARWDADPEGWEEMDEDGWSVE